jgi:pimeloyl-ACP methyl ester carboxylesterase
VESLFTPFHRGGSGTPLLCERAHDVRPPTLAGHAGGPRLDGAFSAATLPDALERALDEAGIATAHIAGNSLGGFLALQLAARGRAESVVALAPAGGWAATGDSFTETAAYFRESLAQAEAAAPFADEIVSTPEGRRQATQSFATSYEHIPAELIAHMLRGVAGCHGALPMLDYALRAGYELDAERITCPVRIVWGTGDQLLPYPSAAVRFREEWLPQADWVELDGVGHCPQLDVPLETAQLILGFTAR